MFGAINALFSGLAFACLIFATLLQREELKLQRKELQLAREEAAATREEIKGQKEQAIAQNETLKQQAFDNTFFELLRNHSEIVRSIDLRAADGNPTSTGRECLNIYYNRFIKRFRQRRSEDISPNDLVHIKNTYRNFLQHSEGDLGHYFRSLLYLVVFVDESHIENKRIYTNLIRAQMSFGEIGLLFYSALSDDASPKMKPLIEKYALLKALRKDSLGDPLAHPFYYSETSY